MWTAILSVVLKAGVKNIVLGVLVTSLLGYGVYQWHSYKNELLERGQQICEEAVSDANVAALEYTIIKQHEAIQELSQRLREQMLINQEAERRHQADKRQVEALQQDMEEQYEEDETYAAWSDSPLPSGVAERLRELARTDSGS